MFIDTNCHLCCSLLFFQAPSIATTCNLSKCKSVCLFGLFLITYNISCNKSAGSDKLSLQFTFPVKNQYFT